MAPKIERLTESFSLGEGPHWDVESQSLFFVDIFGKNILKYNPKTNKVTKASVAPKQASFIIPVAGEKNQFLVTLDNDLAIILWDGESDKISVKETLYSGDSSPGTVKKIFNDGKCDSLGRVWTGTYGLITGGMKNLEAVGNLHSFDSNLQMKTHVDKIKASNGIAFNNKTKKMFYIDTMKKTVDWFDFDLKNGTVSNRRDFFTLDEHDILGMPDGMTIDTDGNLWVAIFEGSRVIKIDGSKPETLLDSIILPAQQVTSVTFGGPNLDELYVTTGCFEFEGAKKPEAPANGAVYKIIGTGAKGLSADNFKLN